MYFKLNFFWWILNRRVYRIVYITLIAEEVMGMRRVIIFSKKSNGHNLALAAHFQISSLTD